MKFVDKFNYGQKWSGSRWIKIDAGFNSDAPSHPACYVIYADGKIIYVGHTSNLKKRLYAHKIDIERYSEGFTTAWGHFESVSIKAHFGNRYGDWAMREVRLIRKLQPEMNCVGASKKRVPV